MLQKRIPLLVALAIVLASIGLTAMQLYPIYNAITSPDRNTNPSASPTNPNNTPATTAKPSGEAGNKNIASFSLFGNFNEVIEDEPDIQELPKTNLRLTLTGVSATENQKSATALIEGPDRATESYRIGDTLPGNASLHSVHKDRVILSRSGKLETLFFPDTDSSTRLLSSVTNTETAVNIAPVNQNTAQNPAYPIKIPEGVSNMTSEQKQSIRDKLSALRSRLRQQ